MSAFMVDAATVNLVVSYAIDVDFIVNGQRVTRDTAQRIGHALMAECARSVRCCYEGRHPRTDWENRLEAGRYTFRYYPRVKPLAALKLAHFIAFQSSHCDDHMLEPAGLWLARFLRTFAQPGGLPVQERDYEALPWGITSPEQLEACIEP